MGSHSHSHVFTGLTARCQICWPVGSESCSEVARVLPVICFNDDVILGGGFKYFSFSSLPAEMFQFDEYFFRWIGSTTN